MLPRKRGDLCACGLQKFGRCHGKLLRIRRHAGARRLTKGQIVQVAQAAAHNFVEGDGIQVFLRRGQLPRQGQGGQQQRLHGLVWA